jgi:hypothetical protein
MTNGGTINWLGMNSIGGTRDAEPLSEQDFHLFNNHDINNNAGIARGPAGPGGCEECDPCDICNECVNCGDCNCVTYEGYCRTELQMLLNAGHNVRITTYPVSFSIVADHALGDFVVPAGVTLRVETAFNVRRDAVLAVEGTLVVAANGRINNDPGGAVLIAQGGRFINYGRVENISHSTVVNDGTIINNGRFEVRAFTVFINNGMISGDTDINVNRDAITNLFNQGTELFNINIAGDERTDGEYGFADDGYADDNDESAGGDADDNDSTSGDGYAEGSASSSGGDYDAESSDNSSGAGSDSSNADNNVESGNPAAFNGSSDAGNSGGGNNGSAGDISAGGNDGCE